MYFDYKGRLRNIPTFLEESTLEECFIDDCNFRIGNEKYSKEN